MIEPRLLTLEDLFADRIHYEVPIYQRPYVWNRDDQWVPLWEDVRDTAVRRLEGKRNIAHFLGAIVIERMSADPGRVKTFSVVDGQQRLTTLQLLIGALRSVVLEKDPERDADIQRMLRNDGRHTTGPLIFKVWPSEHDRASFRATMDLSNDGPPESDASIPGAFHFFRGAIEAWIVSGESNQEARLDALQDTVEGLLQVVAIQLDNSSDAQVIFETLNSRGADLTSLDLAKNSLLRQAGKGDVDVGQLHAQHWHPALGDADYWLETVRQGRYTSARADLFLMHWLTMKTGKAGRVQHLFADFRKTILRTEPPPDPAELVIELSADAKTYRSFDGFSPVSVEGRFFRRLEAMDTTTLIPVALLLFRSEQLPAERRRRALRALESWLVRRMLLGATTAHYNRLLASLLGKLNQLSSLVTADEAIVQTLQAFESESDEWPDDEVVRHRLKDQPLYNWINQGRIRMLLEACEEELAESGHGERILVPENLSIEHALPQNWTANWPLPAGVDEEEGTPERDNHVHVLGNLTLVTSKLNSSMSNAAWSTKRQELAKRSQLLVNQRLCAHEDWNEQRIDERGAELAGYILRTWPGPADAGWRSE